MARKNAHSVISLFYDGQSDQLMAIRVTCSRLLLDTEPGGGTTKACFPNCLMESDFVQQRYNRLSSNTNLYSESSRLVMLKPDLANFLILGKLAQVHCKFLN